MLQFKRRGKEEKKRGKKIAKKTKVEKE